ncbi:MAG: hypothetical protein ACK5QX_06105 [bacterium]
MKLSHTCHQSDAKRWHVELAGRANSGQTNAQKQEMTMTDGVQLVQARQSTPSPQEQLRRLIDNLGNAGGAHLDRIDCMNGAMVRRRENNVGNFAISPDVTVGQDCRGLMEFSADATASGRTGGRDLLAPYRELVDFAGLERTPQANQPAQALVNGLVNVSRNPAYANSTGTPIQLDGQGKVYQATPGAALDATFAQAVSETRAGRPAPNRITSWNDAQINNAVEACVRGRDTLIRCSAVGQEVAAIHLQRRAGQAATR